MPATSIGMIIGLIVDVWYAFYRPLRWAASKWNVIPARSVSEGPGL